MGVSGSGKTSVGKQLAHRKNLPFYDADDFHPKENIAKMKKGIPLQDADRLPWLQYLASQLPVWEQNSGAVLACSALKKAYREQLSVLPTHQLKWIYLKGEYSLIAQRLRSRKGHFFSEQLLASQFEALEEPSEALRVSIAQPIEAIVSQIERTF